MDTHAPRPSRSRSFVTVFLPAAIAIGLTAACAGATENHTATSSQLEIVARIEQGPGNITVTPDGRIIVTLHPFHGAVDRVMEVSRSGTLSLFPNAEWATGGRKANGVGFDAPLAIRTDESGVVWIMDTGIRGNLPPQLVGWNTKTDQLERVYGFTIPADQPISFLNDFQVSLKHKAAFIADTALGGTPALVVLDLVTGEARWVLRNHAYVQAEDVDLIAENRVLTVGEGDGRTNARVGVNPIALDAEERWVYFGAMNGDDMYRIQAADLVNASLSESQLAQRVERFGPRPNSDGITIDQSGNVYITDVAASGIGVVRASDRTYQLLDADTFVSWPDALSFGPDGYIYAAVNQVHRTPALNGGRNEAKPPFLIVRLKGLDAGTAGR